MFPQPDSSPAARGADVAEQNLIAASLHHAAAEGFIGAGEPAAMIGHLQ